MEQHKHCQVCGRPIPVDETFCSEKCREEYEDMVSKRKKRMYVVYGLLAVLLIVIFARYMM